MVWVVVAGYARHTSLHERDAPAGADSGCGRLGGKRRVLRRGW